MEQPLQQSDEQFRLLVAEVRDYAIFMLDTQGYVRSWNTGAQLIKGYSAYEIIGKHFSTFYPPEDVAGGKPERELQIARQEGVYREEGWRLRKDGSLFWASVVLTVLRDSDGIVCGFGKVTRDLTERRQAEEAQRQLREQELQIRYEQAARVQAEANTRLRDSFLNATAHELRTPVTSIMGYAQLLTRRFARGEFTLDRVEKPVRAIALQAQRLDRLTSMLLDVTRMEHGRLVLEHAPIDVRIGIERVVQEIQLISEHHTIVVGLPATPLMVEGDEIRFEQLIYNLVQNAVKYSPMGGVVSVTAGQEGAQALISVSDGGVGIPAEDVPHVFERFYRATNISHANINGLGLGLYLVKEFVERLGGTVELDSVMGQGTTFRVLLPLLREDAAPPQ